MLALPPTTTTNNNNNPKSQAVAEVKDVLQAATRAQVVAVAEGLRRQVEEALRLLQATLADADGGDGDGDGDDGEPRPVDQAALSLSLDALRLSAGLCHEVFAATREQAPAPLCEAAQLLHTHALLALEMCPPVQDAVARLCCAWWVAGGPDKEELLSQTLPFLLVRSSSSWVLVMLTAGWMLEGEQGDKRC